MPDSVQSAVDYLRKKQGFDCKELLGKGTYGSVIRISSEEGVERAAKIVENRVVNLLEIKEWSRFEHPNILKLIDTIFGVDGVVVFVTELMDSTLFHRLQNKDFKRDPQAPEKCRLWAQHSLSGLAYLHQHDLCHLDLRAENIFLSADDTRAVVADFSGLCRTNELKKFCPLPHSLRPPEMLIGSKRVAPMPIDLWAYGLLLANLYLGKGFYVCTIKHQKPGTIEAVMQYKGFFQCRSYTEKFFLQTYPNSRVSRVRILELMSFIDMFLQMDPNLRISAADALGSSFLRGSFLEVPSIVSTVGAGMNAGVLVAARDMQTSSPESARRALSESEKLNVKIVQGSIEVDPDKKKKRHFHIKVGKIKFHIPSPPLFRSEKTKAEDKSKAKKNNSSKILL